MFRKSLLLTALFLFPLFTSFASQEAEPASLNSSRPLPLEKSKAFQKALQAETGTRALEQARIDYLLEQVSNSPYNFYRNGSRYTGKRAEAHLKWKYFRSLKKVKTAEDFINQVASYSKMSGEAYLMETTHKKRVPLRPILINELSLFDQAVNSKKGITQAVSGKES